MKAFRYRSHGGPEVQKFEEIEVPIPGQGEILVKVVGSGINPVDYKLRQGYMGSAFPVPRTMGVELSGYVEGLGEGVEGWTMGEAIYGNTWSGTLAEYATIDASAAGHPPANMDLADAALVPVGALTAWQALEKGEVGPGHTVLIHAAAGGVGTFAVQFAKMLGATRIIGTASPRNHHLLQELGCDEVIDYNTVDFSTVLKDVDFVLDSVGHDTTEKSFRVLRHGGILVSIVGPVDDHGDKRSALVQMQGDGAKLDEFSGMILDLKLKPILDTMLPFARAAEAVAEVEKGHVVGKLGVRVAEPA